jgi:hypothetical protein
MKRLAGFSATAAANAARLGIPQRGILFFGAEHARCEDFRFCGSRADAFPKKAKHTLPRMLLVLISFGPI